MPGIVDDELSSKHALKAVLSTDATKLDSTQLALDRTWLAHERTLMAWVRTATSMISFGFTIYKFFEFERSNAPTGTLHGALSPRDFAVLMAGTGLVSLVLATVAHFREINKLKNHMTAKRISTSAIVAVIVSLFGLAVLLSAILRQ